MEVKAQPVVRCLQGTPEDAVPSAATPPPSTQCLLSINLSLKPPHSPPSHRKCFLVDAHPSSTTPFARDSIKRAVLTRTCSAHSHFLFHLPEIRSVPNTLNRRVAFNALRMFVAQGTVAFGRHLQHSYIKCKWRMMFFSFVVLLDFARRFLFKIKEKKNLWMFLCRSFGRVRSNWNGSNYH